MLGKFIELSTIWTASKPSADETHPGERIWRPRHIGILFAKCRDTWVIVILVAPLSYKDDNGQWKSQDFKFCVRTMLKNVKENSGPSGFKGKGKEVAKDKQKLKKYPTEDWAAEGFPLQVLISFLEKNLQDIGPMFLSDFLVDVLWGWERYFAQIRNEIGGVLSLYMHC